ncbi:hypothetical protein [Micromonospora sp. NPDC050495]|uniref:hypothetical protein n=1 Tax=Micromonospora sp. NPDC050495 TaxID=3154936 RepID=UPI00340B12AF
MSPFLAVLLVLLLGSTCYAAGRLHGQLSYRIGYRFGYRQGYFDGDRGAWNRRRRDAQAAIASALARSTPASVSAPPSRAAVPFAGTAVPAAVTAKPAPGAAPRATATVQLGGLATRQGTTYTGSSFSASVGGGRQTGTLVRRHG